MTEKEIREQLEELYYYREDGRLCWKSTTAFRKAGSVAGWKATSRPYRRVRAGRRHMLEHRAIFLLHFGWLPEVVDHINGDSGDNRIGNLRASSYKNNPKNRKTQENNTSGQAGVHFCNRDKRWVAIIRYNCKQIYLGSYKTKEEAVKARQEGEKRYYGTLARRENNA